MLPLLALSATVAPAIVAPNTSLATTPIAYFVRVHCPHRPSAEPDRRWLTRSRCHARRSIRAAREGTTRTATMPT
jgi:hypothetical protein